LLQPFEDLGRKVSAAWEQSDYRNDAFSKIAASSLEDSRLLNRIAPNEVVDWILTSGKVPPQDVHDFGQPPIVVYQGENFFIQVLFWLDSSTSIHEHGFSGAFGVLAGSSVHSRYVFEPEEPGPARLRLGKTKFLCSELLSQGSVRSIERGNGFAHSLFHLDQPSVSVVVRTHKSEQDTPQYSYFKPYLAVDPFYAPPLPTIQLRMLESLGLIDPKLFWKHARTLATSCEPWTLFRVICAAHAYEKDRDEWRAFLEHASSRDPRMIQRMVRCSEEMSRESKLLSLRKTVLDPTHRFLLALLMNVPNRKVLYQLVAERIPSSDPEPLVLRWLTEIFDDPQKGIKLSPLSTVLLRLAVRHSDFELAEPALMTHFRFNAASEKMPTMRKLWDAIRSLDVLAPLFTCEGSADRELGEAA
jgi:hypothetical protein